MKMRERYIEYIKVVVTAVVIALLLNLEVALLSPNLSRVIEWVRLSLAAVFVPIAIIVLAVFLWRLIVPKRIERGAVFSFYYDTEKGTSAAIIFYKDISEKNNRNPKIVELDGRPGVKEVSTELLAKLND